LFYAKEPSKVEAINDINGDLINLYKVVQNHLQEFCVQFRWTMSSRQMFEWLKQDYDLSLLTDIQRAARFYYLQKHSFQAMTPPKSFASSPYKKAGLNLTRMEEDLSIAHMRLNQVYIENGTWQKVVDRYDRETTFFYCDPPYHETEGYGVEFGDEQYIDMAKRMRSMKGKVLVSINDTPFIRDVFKELNIATTRTLWSVKIGESRAVQELLISNYKLPKS